MEIPFILLIKIDYLKTPGASAPNLTLPIPWGAFESFLNFSISLFNGNYYKISDLVTNKN